MIWVLYSFSIYIYGLFFIWLAPCTVINGSAGVKPTPASTSPRLYVYLYRSFSPVVMVTTHSTSKYPQPPSLSPPQAKTSTPPGLVVSDELTLSQRVRFQYAHRNIYAKPPLTHLLQLLPGRTLKTTPNFSTL